MSVQLERLCALLNADMQDVDLHTEVAKKMFDTDSPTPEQRDMAKRRSFFILYGGLEARRLQYGDGCRHNPYGPRSCRICAISAWLRKCGRLISEALR